MCVFIINISRMLSSKELLPQTKLVITMIREALDECMLHNRWLHANHFCDYLHAKYNIADEIKFNKQSLVRGIARIFNSERTHSFALKNGMKIDF